MDTNKLNHLIIRDKVTFKYKASPMIEGIHKYHDCKIPLPEPSYDYEIVKGQILNIILSINEEYKNQFNITPL